MSEEQSQELILDGVFSDVAPQNGEFNCDIPLNGSSVTEETTAEVKKDSAEVAEDDDSKKLFVGGLSWETTEDDMRAYFGQWGAVTSCSIKVDKLTGNSRGFGFVTMESEECIRLVTTNGPHHLKNKKIDPKPAKPTSVVIKKIFVGGLSPDVTEDQIKEYFFQFGPVESVDLPFDNQKGKRKTYIFLSFTTEEAAKLSTATEKQDVCGSMCDVRLAVPKDQLAKNNMQNWGPYGSAVYQPAPDYYSYDQAYASPYAYDNSAYYASYGNGYADSYAMPQQPYVANQRGSYSGGKMNTRGSTAVRGNQRGTPYVQRGNRGTPYAPRGAAFVPRGNNRGGNANFHPYARPF